MALKGHTNHDRDNQNQLAAEPFCEKRFHEQYPLDVRDDRHALTLAPSRQAESPARHGRSAIPSAVRVPGRTRAIGRALTGPPRVAGASAAAATAAIHFSVK